MDENVFFLTDFWVGEGEVFFLFTNRDLRGAITVFVTGRVYKGTKRGDFKRFRINQNCFVPVS